MIQGSKAGKTTEISTHFKDSSLDDMNRDAMVKRKGIQLNTTQIFSTEVFSANDLSYGFAGSFIWAPLKLLSSYPTKVQFARTAITSMSFLRRLRWLIASVFFLHGFDVSLF